MKYIVTVDIGTTSVKVGLFDNKLNEYGFVSTEYLLITPKNDYIELEPKTYWDSMQQAIRKVIAKANINGDDINAIALCSQGETIIPIDEQGNALHNAIVWVDSRARKEATFLSEKIGDDAYYKTTGLSEFGPADPICKLLWFKNNCPQLYVKTYKFLLLTDYIAYLLSGQIVSEWTMMCSTGYYDINKHEIWNDVLDASAIDKNKIPDVCKSGVVAGDIIPKVAAGLGVPDNTKIIISANDQMCGAVGGGNIMPGTVTETTGTAMLIAATVKKPNYENAGKILFYKHVNDYYLMAPYVNTASIILKWFKDEFCIAEEEKCKAQGINVYEHLGKLADNVDVLSDGLILYPQFAGKNSPNINPKTKGAFINIGLDTKKGHIVRAIFEGVAYMLKENILAIEKKGIDISEVRSLGGGSKSDVWNQIKADVLNKTIVTLKSEESTSLGVAIVASVKLGWFDDLQSAIDILVKYNKKYYPNKENVEKYKKGFEFYLEMEKALTKLFENRFYENEM